MDRCPVCDANLKNGSVCNRCKADVSPLISLKTAAQAHQAAAIGAFLNEDAIAMLLHAKRAFSKRQTPQACRLLACAAMLAGEADLALRAWHLLQNPATPTTGPAGDN